MKPTNLIIPVLTWLAVMLFSAGCGKNNSAAVNASGSGSLTWISGLNTVLGVASYGTKNTTAASNIPGARKGSVTWRDANNNLWLFGGYGNATSAASQGYLDDLWKFDGNQWTWIAGDNSINGLGAYGTLGQPAVSNCPPARVGALAWIDLSGNFWLFGGQGPSGYFNDVWKFNGSNWVWVAGPQNYVSPLANYGVKGTASTNNQPGARNNPAGWADAQGNLWMFGGSGFNQNQYGLLSDVWKFNVSNLLWTWTGGTALLSQNGIYGIQGTANAANSPGGRMGAAYWTDNSGRLWLFGGSGYDSPGTNGYLNDLWRFDGTVWTWISGSNTVNAVSNFGTKKVAASTNVPGAREFSSGFTDSSNNVWVFGGTIGTVRFADFWKFDGTNWTWVYGSNSADQNGTYGLPNLAGPLNSLGAREETAAWTKTDGSVWFFGGYGVDFGSGYSYLNDLWKLTP